MKIAVDIDDTVAKTNECLIEEAIKYDKEFVKGRGFKNKNAYSFMEMFYWSVIDLDKFYSLIRNGNFFKNVSVIEGAVENINKLYDEGDQIIFITRRKNNLKTRMKTKKWLKSNGFKFNKLILGGERKGEICNNLGVDVFIDNDERNIYDAIDYGIDSVLKGTIYNKDEKELQRIDKWDDIYKWIKGVK